MKYSAVALATLVAAAQAQPRFLNVAEDLAAIRKGQPVTLKYEGCDAGCTITLVNGPETAVKPVRVLQNNAVGASTDVTLTSSDPSGSLAFEILDNATRQKNYSGRFEYAEGSSSAPESDAPTSVAATTTAARELTSSADSAVSTTSLSAPTRAAHTSHSSAATPSAASSSLTSIARNATTTTTTTRSLSSAATKQASPTTSIPDKNGVGRVSASWALAAGALAALAYLN